MFLKCNSKFCEGVNCETPLGILKIFKITQVFSTLKQYLYYYFNNIKIDKYSNK